MEKAPMPNYDNLPIYILTFGGREQITFANLPLSLQQRVVFVVHPDEAMNFHKYDCRNVLVCAYQGTGAGNVRDFIMGHSTAAGNAVTIMLDDDIGFRAYRGEKKFVQAEPHEIEAAFSDMTDLRGAIYTSFGTTFFNDGAEPWEKYGRHSYSFFIDSALYTQHDLTFLGVPTMEDIFFTLSAFKAGLYNRINKHMCAVSSTPSNGGENYDGNRAARHDAAAKQLAQMFPDYVRLRNSKNAVHMRNIGTPTDITVQWKKAGKQNAPK